MVKSIKKILIVNTFGIGDVLFTTPLVRAIKIERPLASVGYLGNRRTEAILRSNPRINKVWVYERDEFQAISRVSKWRFLKAWWTLLQEIKSERYDTVLDLSLNSSFGFFLKYAGIPRRIGYDYKNRGRFLTQSIPLTGYEGRHVIDYYCDLLDLLGIKVADRRMELTIPKGDLSWAAEWLQQSRLADGRPLVGLVPGGGASWGKDASFKRWPAEKYAKLVDKIVENSSAQIILMGDINEQDLCRTVARLCTHPVLVAAGQTTVGQMAALMKSCSFVIVNDGGPLHVAVASGVRTVSIFGPVDEAVYGPYPEGEHMVVKKQIACQPCYRRFRRAECDHVSCLNQLDVTDVWRKVEILL